MYNQISENKTRTWMLIIIMMSFTLLLATILCLVAGLTSSEAFVLGGVFTSVYAFISYYFSDKIALASSGAKSIAKAEAPELYNLVENLCIANGQPMPGLYIVQDESPNAFATGRDPQHASIAFTTGILRILDKKELEGVAAHELSHVKNYDIRVMTIVVVLVGAVMLISDILLRSSFGGNKKEGGTALVLIGLVLAILSPIFAQIIQLAVSRQREYLADASGALLTRYPEGLASALQKISSASKPLDRANHATAHLFISNPFGSKEKTRRPWFSKLFATHPPVEERVARLLSMGK
jgi:heat shock protein HtpX